MDLDENNCLEKLTPDDWEVLFETEEENYRRGHFERIFPLEDEEKMKQYSQFFEFSRYKNLLVEKCMKSKNKILEKLCKRISTVNV